MTASRHASSVSSARVGVRLRNSKVLVPLVVGVISGVGATLILDLVSPKRGSLERALFGLALSAIVILALELWLIAERKLHAIDYDLRDLINSLTTINWTFDADEHRKEVYGELEALASDEHVSQFWVISLFNPVARDDSLNSFARDERISDETRQAMASYFMACERALNEREGFVYRRVVVFRSDTPVPVPTGTSREDEAVRAKIAQHALSGRKPFAQHCLKMLDPNVPRARGENRRPELKFFLDGGRTIDTAIALALNRAGDPIGLVIEISLLAVPPTSSKAESPTRQAMGLLTMNHPRNGELCRSFKQVFDSIADNRRKLPTLDCPEEVLRQAAE